MAASPLLAAALMWLLALGVSKLALVPIFGMAAGNSYIEEWVIRPEHCVPPRSRIEHGGAKGKKNIRAALCVSIRTGEKAPLKGRVVFITSKFAVLLDPATGRVSRVPTSGADVEVVPTL